MSYRNLLTLFAVFTFGILVGCSNVLAQRPLQGRPQGGPPPQRRLPQDGRPPFGRQPDSRPPINRPPQGPPGAGFLSAEMRFDGKIVKGVPYTAQAVAENTQILANGARITRKNTATIYRDSEGRTRREIMLDSVGPFVLDGNQITMIFINDHVSGDGYVLFPEDKTANRIRLRPQPNAPEPKGPPEASEVKTESLGKKIIDNVEAEGTRTTFTIPAGRIGNDQPLDIIAERWYSNELQVIVMSKHSDPRFGETVYRLTNINRTEVRRLIFTMPNDYRIVEGPPPQPERIRDGLPQRKPE